jgi:hypothetical protein
MSGGKISAQERSQALAQIRTDALAALRRARKRAEELATRTGTMLIEAVDGKPVRVQPPPLERDAVPKA